MKYNKSNLEVKGSMNEKAANHVGYILAVSVLIGVSLLGTAAIIAAS